MKINRLIYNLLSEKIMKKRGILKESETIEHALNRVLSSLITVDRELNNHKTDAVFESKLTELVYSGTLILGTPILTNGGRASQVTAACTVLPIKFNHGQVDYQSFRLNSLNMLSSALGTGYDLSPIDHPVEALIQFNDILNHIDKQLTENNKRPVASMATLRADHPRILEFIRSKRDVDFFKWRFNISIFLTDALITAAKSKQMWPLKDNHGMVVSQINAAELLHEIAQCAHFCGEPGILFKDRLEKDNPTPQWSYQSTAPCAEVAMAAGDACQFSYLNLANFVLNSNFNIEKFAEAVCILTRFLDSSVEYTLKNELDAGLHLPLVYEKRRIGVGITGFADLLIKLEIPYDDANAVVLAQKISELLDFHSKKTSVELAKARGKFPSFDKSRYLDPNWIRRKSNKMTGVISSESWDTLYDDIMRHGMRHATTTAMPPTGTSSTIANVSKSLEPYFSFKDYSGHIISIILDVVKKYYVPEQRTEVLEHLQRNGIFSEEICLQKPFLKTACQIDPNAHIAIQAGFQRFLDDSISKTVNLDQKTTVNDILALIYQSYDMDLKGLAVFRNNCLSERSASISHRGTFFSPRKTEITNEISEPRKSTQP
jgi:ribonucleoside-diphosphate reductase alpha chain